MMFRFIVKYILNQKLKRYGRMLKLDIDDNKSISLELKLKGETSPILVNIGKYEILSGQVSGIKLSEISTSREWITELIQTLYPNPIIEFPYAKLLNIIL